MNKALPPMKKLFMGKVFWWEANQSMAGI